MPALTPDSEATLALVERLAQRFGETAIERDRLGGTAKSERDALRESGLLALSIPTSFGGAGGNWALVFESVRRFARADPSLAHLFGFHHLLLATVRLFGRPEQWQIAYQDAASQRLFWGNALNPLDTGTRLTEHGGALQLDGKKSFCSGALDSDRLIVSAHRNDSNVLVIGAIPSNRAGLTFNHDWDNMGQRQTDSGSVEFRATPERVAFMVRHTSGLVCVGARAARLQALELPLMVPNNTEAQQTAFTVSVDYRHGTSTGISATDRSATIRALAKPSAVASDFARPGHVFPLRAQEGGVLARPGHTEAAADLAELAGFSPLGALAEIVNDVARDTEEEARAVLKEIIDNANPEAVKAFGHEVKNAGKSSPEGEGNWAKSTFEDLVQYNDGFKTNLIGTPQQIAERIVALKAVGVDLVLAGFLHYLEEVEYFGQKVLPLVRELEAEQAKAA